MSPNQIPGVVMEMSAVATPLRSMSSTARCGDQPYQVGMMRPPPCAAMRSFTSSNQNGGTMWWCTSISFGWSGAGICASTAGATSTAGAATAVALKAAAVAMNCRRDGPHGQPTQCRPKCSLLPIVINSSRPYDLTLSDGATERQLLADRAAYRSRLVSSPGRPGRKWARLPSILWPLGNGDEDEDIQRHRVLTRHARASRYQAARVDVRIHQKHRLKMR